MPTVGEQLRIAREAQKLAIHQVADFTKIRGDHIRALEEGNYSVFSAPVYIRGFVRTYSNLLKLDANKILDQVNQELAGTSKATQTSSQPKKGIMDDAMFQLSNLVRRAALPIVAVVVVIAIGVVSYFVWQHRQHRDPLEGLGPGIYKAPPANETLPLPKPSN